MSVIQFIALTKDEQSTETAWPAMKETHPYWQKATKYAAHTAHTYLKKVYLTMFSVSVIQITIVTKNFRSDCNLDYQIDIVIPPYINQVYVRNLPILQILLIN